MRRHSRRLLAPRPPLPLPSWLTRRCGRDGGIDDGCVWIQLLHPREYDIYDSGCTADTRAHKHALKAASPGHMEVDTAQTRTPNHAWWPDPQSRRRWGRGGWSTGSPHHLAHPSSTLWHRLLQMMPPPPPAWWRAACPHGRCQTTMPVAATMVGARQLMSRACPPRRLPAAAPGSQRPAATTCRAPCGQPTRGTRTRRRPPG